MTEVQAVLILAQVCDYEDEDHRVDKAMRERRGREISLRANTVCMTTITYVTKSHEVKPINERETIDYHSPRNII